MKRGSSAEKRAEALQAESKTGESLNVEILIVGGGIAGLATALALHRMGLKSLVLERSDALRAGGTSIALWTNAWCALEALGISSELGKDYWCLDRLGVGTLSNNGKDFYLRDDTKWRHELRCVERKFLLASLAKPLPSDTIRFNSRVVDIRKGGKASRTVVELEDGTFISTKVLLGCDGVHSVVSKWMGLPEPKFTGRHAIRGLATYPEGHTIAGEPALRLTLGEGVKVGIAPINSTKVYWFISYSLPPNQALLENPSDPELIKQEALEVAKGFPEETIDAIKQTPPEALTSNTLRVRWVWPVMMGPRQLTKGGATVAGDAMHAMTPDIAQGGCSALEDAVVLARSIAEAMKKTWAGDEEEQMRFLEKALEDYVRARQGRVFGLVARAYFLGWVLESRSWLIKWFRKSILLPSMKASAFLAPTQYQCGPLLEA